MTMLVPVPADIEAEALAELIADARWVRLPDCAPLHTEPKPAVAPIRIPERALSLVSAYPDYGT